MSDESSKNSLQKVVRTVERLDPYLDILAVIVAYLTMFASAWIILSLFYDIPAPSIVEVAPEHPEAAIFAMAFLLLFMSKDAAKWYKHRLREEA